MSENESDYTAGPVSHQGTDSHLETGEFLTRFAADLGMATSAYLRVPTEITVGRVEEGLLGEFLESTRRDLVRAAVEVGEESTPILFGLGRAAAVSTLEILLGGTPSPVPAGKPVTDIESAVLTAFARVLVASFSRTFHRNTGSLGSPRILSDGGSPANDWLPETPVMRCLLSIQIGDVQDSLDLLVPAALLRDASIAQDPSAAAGTRSVSSEHRQRLMRLLNRSRVLVEVRLPDQRLKFRDLTGLQPGHTLLLDHAIDQQVICLVNGERVASGNMALSKRKRAFVLAGPPASP